MPTLKRGCRHHAKSVTNGSFRGPPLPPPDLSKALSAAVIGFDGSREDFDNFSVHLAFYLDSVMGNCIHCWTQPSRATTAGDRSGAHLNLE